MPRQTQAQTPLLRLVVDLLYNKSTTSRISGVFTYSFVNELNAINDIVSWLVSVSVYYLSVDLGAKCKHEHPASLWQSCWTAGALWVYQFIIFPFPLLSPSLLSSYIPGTGRPSYHLNPAILEPGAAL